MVENMICRMAQTGQVNTRISEKELIQLLESLNQQMPKSTSTVKFDRRRAALDSDDDDLQYLTKRSLKFLNLDDYYLYFAYFKQSFLLKHIFIDIPVIHVYPVSLYKPNFITKTCVEATCKKGTMFNDYLF